MDTSLLPALLAGIAIGGASGYLGSLLLGRRMSLVAGPLEHLTLPRVALALLLGFDVSLGAFPYAVPPGERGDNRPPCGGLLIAALVAIPVAIARIVARDLRQYATVATVAGTLSAIIGVALASLSGAPAGPLIVVVSASLFVATLPFARRHST